MNHSKTQFLSRVVFIALMTSIIYLLVLIGAKTFGFIYSSLMDWIYRILVVASVILSCNLILSNKNRLKIIHVFLYGTIHICILTIGQSVVTYAFQKWIYPEYVSESKEIYKKNRREQMLYSYKEKIKKDKGKNLTQEDSLLVENGLQKHMLAASSFFTARGAFFIQLIYTPIWGFMSLLTVILAVSIIQNKKP
jgi:hypothetical protein